MYKYGTIYTGKYNTEINSKILDNKNRKETKIHSSFYGLKLQVDNKHYWMNRD